MGQFSAHWARYTKDVNRRTLRALGVLASLPLIVALGYWLSQETGWAIPLMAVLLPTWVVVLTRIALRASRVPCPQCGTVYTRGKFLVNCPQCGLRMLQEDPS